MVQLDNNNENQTLNINKCQSLKPKLKLNSKTVKEYIWKGECRLNLKLEMQFKSKSYLDHSIPSLNTMTTVRC